MYIYKYMSIYVYIYMYTYTCIYIYIYIHTCIIREQDSRRRTDDKGRAGAGGR